MSKRTRNVMAEAVTIPLTQLYSADIVRLNKDGNKPKQIAELISASNQLSNGALTSKMVSDHLGYLKKKKIVKTPAVNKDTGTFAEPATERPGCTPSSPPSPFSPLSSSPPFSNHWPFIIIGFYSI